jgi:long-chain acyl-CoA synthetase
MPGVDAKVMKLNSTVQLIETDDNEIGELYVRGANVMQNYTNPEQLGKNGVDFVTGNYRDDIWLKTGDLFHRDSDAYLFFRGRTKELIKQSGYCLYPKDIEDEVSVIKEIKSTVVLPSTDGHGNEYAILLIVPTTQNDEIKANIKSKVKALLPREYTPQDIKFVESLPTNINGKIDKKKCRDLLGDVENYA